MMQATKLSERRDQPARLPLKFQRGGVERIITAVGPHIGLPACALNSLLAMIHTTRPSDWTDGRAAPICYREQYKVALGRNVSTRTMRAHERVLEDLGLIEKIVAADGSRGSFDNGEYNLGISFQPLIDRFPELLRISLRVEADIQDEKVLRTRCSATRRTLGRTLAKLIEVGAEGPELDELLRLKDSLPRRYEDMRKDRLEQVFSVADKAARDSLDLLWRKKTSAAAEEIGLPLLEDTIEDKSLSCSAETAEGQNARAEDAHSTDGQTDCLESSEDPRERGHKIAHSETFTLDQLRDMASEDMRQYIDGRRRLGQQLSIYDFVQAAIAILPEIRIGVDVWHALATVIGDEQAALCVLVVDANRFRAVSPVREPGAMLRAMTKIAKHGGLNLHASLITLKRSMISA